MAKRLDARAGGGISSESMICSYCGTHNAETEHRCRRCGRRPDDTLTGEFSLVGAEGALAAKPQRIPLTASNEAGARTGPRPVPQAQSSRPPARPGIGHNTEGATLRPVQSSLFPDKSNPKVVEIADYAAPPLATPRTRTPAASKAGVRRPRPVPEGQGQLPFLPPQTAKPRSLGTTVDSVIYCEAPVATAMHRLFAAALDTSMVVIAYGLFLTVYHALGGAFVLNKTNTFLLGGMLLVIALAYGVVWALAGGGTAGMHWMRLRLITFDGFPPEPRQRLLRFFGSCLSTCTLLGLLWALADEEGLTWQDHISRTFPTPVALDHEIFRRV